VAPAPSAGQRRACADSAVAPATLDRFEQWEARIRGGPPSLDRRTLLLDAQAWSGHCQELDVLRTVLERQLGCALPEQGRCGAPGSAR
jgi:hypothetical protein